MAHTDSISSTMAKLFSSVIYSTAVPIVFILVGALILGVNSTAGLHTWFRGGDIDIALSLVISGPPVFIFMAKLVAHLEKIARPVPIDHFRHTFILYLAAIILGNWLLVWYRQLGGGLQYGYAVVLFLTIVLGIVVNAVALTYINHRAKNAA